MPESTDNFLYDNSNAHAKRYSSTGSVLCVLNVPTNTEFGIDWRYWRTGPNFRGIKEIPAGPHFIYVSAASKETGELAPRIGLFHYFDVQDFLLLQWNDSEMLNIVDDNSDDWRRVQENMLEVETYLHPYPHEAFRTWVSLSNCIKKSVILKLQPTSRWIYAVAQYQSEASNSQQRLRQRNYDCNFFLNTGESEDMLVQSESPKCSTSAVANTTRPRHSPLSSENHPQLPRLNFVKGTRIRYSNIASQPFHPSSEILGVVEHSQEHLRAISRNAIDRSAVLVELIQHNWSDDANNQSGSGLSVVGELQFAFVCFILGNDYDSFEHWMRLLRLLCYCQTAFIEYHSLFEAFISALYYQLQHIPEEFLFDIVIQDNVLYHSIRRLLQDILCQEEDDDANANYSEKLLARALGLLEFCRGKYHWELMDELEEEKPVIVENIT